MDFLTINAVQKKIIMSWNPSQQLQTIKLAQNEAYK